MDVNVALRRATLQAFEEEDPEGGRGKRWKRRRRRRPPIRVRAPSLRTQPGQTCGDPDRIRLQHIVNTACHSQSQRQTGCDHPGLSCDDINLRGRLAMRCAQARRRINQACFGGGDAGHRQAEATALRNVANCRAAFRARCAPFVDPRDAHGNLIRRSLPKRHRQFFD